MNSYSSNFRYKNGILYCENLNLAEMASDVKTPCYLYSKNAIYDFYRTIQNIDIPNKLICYAVKACSNINIINLLAHAGCGADCVSGGEIYRSIAAGVNVNKIVFSGTAKTVSDLEYAINQNILQINAESWGEIFLINEIAKKLEKIQDIAIRVRPNVEVETHKYIATGDEDSKFGISADDINCANLEKIKNLSNIKLRGFSMHIGSQLFDTKPYISSARRLIEVANIACGMGFEVERLDFGGGFGVTYRHDEADAFDFMKFGQELNNLIMDFKGKLKTVIFEPGRFLVANSGILLSKVLCIKESGGRKFAILDAGMNDLMRVAMYGAHHDILPLKERSGQDAYDICGTVCESSDFFAKNRNMPLLEEGDVVAIMSAGAYGSSMSSEYNSRPLIPEFLVDNCNITTIRKERTWKDLILHEQI